MSRLRFLKEQSAFAAEMTQKLVKKVDEADWMTPPKIIASNINWQVGHILIAKYFHSIMCVIGRQKPYKEQMPLKDYAAWYAMGSNPAAFADSKPSKEKLLADLAFMDEKVLQTIDSISEEDLDQEVLEENPMAKTKYEALNWSYMHQMWHNGQIAMIKRVLKRK